MFFTHCLLLHSLTLRQLVPSGVDDFKCHVSIYSSGKNTSIYTANNTMIKCYKSCVGHSNQYHLQLEIVISNEEFFFNLEQVHLSLTIFHSGPNACLRSWFTQLFNYQYPLFHIMKQHGFNLRKKKYDDNKYILKHNKLLTIKSYFYIFP